MAPHGRLKRDGYPSRSKYFQALIDVVTNKEIRELSEELCKCHRKFPVWQGLSYFPNLHATGGDTLLRRY